MKYWDFRNNFFKIRIYNFRNICGDDASNSYIKDDRLSWVFHKKLSFQIKELNLVQFDQTANVKLILIGIFISPTCHPRHLPKLNRYQIINYCHKTN